MTDTYKQPEHGWTCFHCGETFTTYGAARDHFGHKPKRDAACQIKGWEERGLVMALSKAERELDAKDARIKELGAENVRLRENALRCHDCWRPYEEFPDFVVPHNVWTEISPTGDEGGLLCASCICKRLQDKGITCSGSFTSGPIVGPLAEIEKEKENAIK